MSLKEKWKESRIPNIEANIELLKKRQKTCKNFSWFHLGMHLLFFIISIFSLITMLQASLFEEPTLHLTTLILGVGITSLFLYMVSFKEYIFFLDFRMNGKLYDILILLKRGEK